MSTIDKEKFQFVKRDDFASEAIDAPAYSYWGSVFRQFMKKKSTVVMLGILVAIILMSFIYPMFSKFDFNDVSKVNDFSARYIKPNAEHWFGTDSNGKSLFDGVWFGARNSILISVIATVINLVIGVFVGGIWGISKSVDRVMMEVYNVISNIPSLLIVIVLTYSIGAGFWNLIFAMSVTTWIGIAFMIRVQILRYRDLEYNLASRTLNANLEDCCQKYHASIGICYCDNHDSNASKLYLIRSLLVILRSWITDYSTKFGAFDFRLFTKRNNQCLLVLDSIDNSCLGILVPFRSWSKLSGC